MGQWAQTVHMFPTHITSQLGNAHSSQPLILLFFPVGFVREMSLPAPDLRKGSAPCVPDGLSSRLGFDQGKEAAGGWLLPQNVAVEAFGSVWKCLSGLAPGSCAPASLLPQVSPWGTHQGPAAPQKCCRGTARVLASLQEGDHDPFPSHSFPRLNPHQRSQVWVSHQTWSAGIQ